jgi:hypothetical protein
MRAIGSLAGLVILATMLVLGSCGGSGGTGGGGSGGNTGGGNSAGGSADGGATVDLDNPILFVTQVPVLGDFPGRASAFGNDLAGVEEVPRGGDLMVCYPQGTLRKLTREAGFGSDEFQGANAIAVREPSVHWSSTKAVFSMIVGSPTEQTASAAFFWQIYEVTGLAAGETARITKVAKQPAMDNNVSPFYASDDRLLFTSDGPRSGMVHLFPNLDEYESAQSVSGIWSLDPVSGELHLLNHTPSGAFSPSIDSFGRVVFIRWDHLQRDQQRDAGDKGALNFSSEAASATSTGGDKEVFPEPRLDVTQTPYGPVNGHRFNSFTPWQMNEDGTGEGTLNHIGRHELNFGFLGRSFANDPALSDLTDDSQHANTVQVNTDGGLLHLRADPARPGSFVAIEHSRSRGTRRQREDRRLWVCRGVRARPARTDLADHRCIRDTHRPRARVGDHATRRGACVRFMPWRQRS